jgi:hypothetical protein
LQNNRPRTAGRGDPPACAEGDRTFAVHEFIDARKRSGRGWIPRRGEQVLVHVRTGVRFRAIYIGSYLCYGEEWAWVILAGKVRGQPRMLLSAYDPKRETELTLSLLLSLGWAKSQAS